MQASLQMKDVRRDQRKRSLDQARKWTPVLIERERELIREGIPSAFDANGEPDPYLGLARKVNCPRTAIWSLLYRPPKIVDADVFLALGELYDAECERQLTRYAAERAEVQACTRFSRALVGVADRLVGAADLMAGNRPRKEKGAQQ